MEEFTQFLRDNLTEEKTDALIEWLDERLDFPGPDYIVKQVLDAMLPGLFIQALETIFGETPEDGQGGD